MEPADRSHDPSCSVPLAFLAHVPNAPSLCKDSSIWGGDVDLSGEGVVVLGCMVYVKPYAYVRTYIFIPQSVCSFSKGVCDP